MRLIDADKLVNALYYVLCDSENSEAFLAWAESIINCQPAFEYGWVPSERKPERDGWYVVTKDGMYMDSYVSLSKWNGTSWRLGDSVDLDESDVVTAWLPALEPYDRDKNNL